MLFDWFIFIPLVIAFALVAYITLICGRAGGSWRVLGVLVSLGLGGFCFLVGYLIGIEGFSLTRHNNITYPVGGWIGMIGGCLISILGIWLSLKKGKG